MLTAIPSAEEAKFAVFSMNGCGAPGPDGFGGCFYQTYWDIVSEDVYKVVLQFFSKNWILPGVNSNLVALIPKFTGADRIRNHRPIAPANFQFKIITKLLVDKLSMIGPKIISPSKEVSLKVGKSMTSFVLVLRP